MKTLKKIMLGCMLLAAFVVTSDAHLILEGYYTFDESPQGGSGEEVLWIESELGLSGLVHLGKMMENGPESDPLNLFADGYITVSGYDNSDVDSAIVSWDLTGTGYRMAAVFVKDGQPAGATLYSVSFDQRYVSSGDQVVIMNPDAGGNGGISHISFFGLPTKDVPDGGMTVVMLGCALAAIGLISRRLG